MKVFAKQDEPKRLGTIFYEITLDAIEAALDDPKANIILRYRIHNEGWDALDLEHNLFGSAVIDDVLYLCETDGQEIEIKGRHIEPEFALEIFDIADVFPYIQEADKDTILRKVTGYELDNSVLLDNIVVDMIQDGETLRNILRAADDIGILDSYL